MKCVRLFLRILQDGPATDTSISDPCLKPQKKKNVTSRNNYRQVHGKRPQDTSD